MCPYQVQHYASSFLFHLQIIVLVLFIFRNDNNIHAKDVQILALIVCNCHPYYLAFALKINTTISCQLIVVTYGVGNV